MDVFGLQPFRALLHVELHALPFIQRSISLRLDGAVVHENILTGIALDEAVPFIVVEPFDSAYFGHFLPPARFAVRWPRVTGLALNCAMFRPCLSECHQISARFIPMR